MLDKISKICANCGVRFIENVLQHIFCQRCDELVSLNRNIVDYFIHEMSAIRLPSETPKAYICGFWVIVGLNK